MWRRFCVEERQTVRDMREAAVPIKRIAKHLGRQNVSLRKFIADAGGKVLCWRQPFTRLRFTVSDCTANLTRHLLKEGKPLSALIEGKPLGAHLDLWHDAKYGSTIFREVET